MWFVVLSMKSDLDIGDFIIENRASLQEWGDLIAAAIGDKHGDSFKVPATPRVKDPDSARKKQLKKQYANPVVDMTDLVGVRFVVLTSDELGPILETIETSDCWNHKQTRDPNAEARENPATFGYQSHHYELRPTNGAQWCCEVQVRTLLQHTMAELSHDAIYKSPIPVPSQAERLVARSIALMETTDELMCMAMDTIRTAQAPFEAMRKEALVQASSVGGAGADLLDDLFEAYPESITFEGLAEFRDFIRSRSYILERIASRKGRGVFAFPASTLLVYWLAFKHPRSTSRHWPYPGSVRDLEMIYSDLGIGR